MKKLILKNAIMASILFSIFFCASGCKDNAEAPIDLSDPLTGEMIVTAENLCMFIDEGKTNTAEIAANIDIGNKMLTISKERGAVTIKGGGFTISGNGDCVIRLLDDATVILENITIDSKNDGIGIIGGACIGGGNCEVKGILNGIFAEKTLNILKDTSISFAGATGSGMLANGILLGQNAHVNALGGNSAVVAKEYDLELSEDAVLSAETVGDGQYNAVKVAGELILRRNAIFSANNQSGYHGAEIGSLLAEENATVYALGGKNGCGLFIITLKNDVIVNGSCKPEMRHEIGRGSITFAK